MSAAQPSVDGFVFTRGRGYRPDQVDQQIAELSQDRDGAWERAARLTVLAKRMEEEAARLRERVAEVEALGPQTYESLGGRAAQIMLLAADEGELVRAEVREECRALLDRAKAEARDAREAARADSDAVRAEVEAYDQQVQGIAQGVAEAERTEARREVKAVRGEALATLKEARRRAAEVLQSLESGHAERRAALEREIVQREAELEVRTAELTAYAQAALVDAQRAFSEAGEQARHGQEDAQARAAELVAGARAAAERVTRDTERLVREQTESGDEMRAHMTHVRNSLAALTGRAPAEG